MALAQGAQIPVFLHGLWRCGSTYVWSRFRESPDCYCYYEPLHHGLARLTEARIARDTAETTQDNAHPDLAAPYFQEFAPLLRESGRGVKNFRAGLAYDRFALGADEAHPDLVRYIDTLLIHAHATGKAPVLGLNRTVLRQGWMRERFGGFHLYIDRDPLEIWQSYQAHAEKGNVTFFAAWLRIIERNYTHPLFQPLFEDLGLRGPVRRLAGKAKPYYRRRVQGFSEAQSYGMVFYLWLAAALQGLSFADEILDMHRVEEDGYVRNITESVARHCGIKVDFSDARRQAPEVAGFDVAAVEQAALRCFPLEAYQDYISVERVRAALPRIHEDKRTHVAALLERAG